MTVRRFFSHSIPMAVFVAGGVLLAPLPHPAAGQTQTTLTNVIPQDAEVTVHAKITALDPARRRVTLTGQSGVRVILQAAPSVRLEMLKVGDVVDAQYYRSVAFLISPPGTAAPEDEIQRTIARPVQAPGGVGAQTTRISGLIVGVDPGAHSIDLVDPTGGAVLTVNVTDPDRRAALPALKVGDTITAVISEALAVSILPASKGLF
ncbi:hypothetical protein [Azospirillum sp. sgz301742]